MLDHIKALFKSEGVWLAGIPILCILFSLAFELGYSAFFGYPAWALNADLKTIIDAFVQVLPRVAALICFYQMATACIKARFIHLRAIGVAMYESRWVIFFAVANSWVQLSWAPVIVCLVFAFVLLYAIPRYQGRIDKRYWPRVRHFVSLRQKVMQAEIQKIKTDRVEMAFRLLVVVPLICYSAGMSSAYLTTRHFVTNLKEPDGKYAVIRRYGDTLILAEIDVPKNKLTRHFRFIQFADSDHLLFELEKGIGHYSAD